MALCHYGNGDTKPTTAESSLETHSLSWNGQHNLCVTAGAWQAVVWNNIISGETLLLLYSMKRSLVGVVRGKELYCFSFRWDANMREWKQSMKQGSSIYFTYDLSHCFSSYWWDNNKMRHCQPNAQVSSYIYKHWSYNCKTFTLCFIYSYASLQNKVFVVSRYVRPVWWQR